MRDLLMRFYFENHAVDFITRFNIKPKHFLPGDNYFELIFEPTKDVYESIIKEFRSEALHIHFETIDYRELRVILERSRTIEHVFDQLADYLISQDLADIDE